ncbi:MAG TPA: BLUF domain-containing protein [Limnobacter sp.]|nr:BLUF domain-containing protein [Limnobacter sp.]
MLSLVYTSTQTGSMERSAFASLCASSSAKNRILGISGVLLFNGHEFLQCLEGPAAHVSAVYAAILKDPRHNDIRLLHHSAITDRMFDGWAMGGWFADNRTDLSGLPYGFLDHRLHRPWHTLGQGAADLVFEYAKVKRNVDSKDQTE